MFGAHISRRDPLCALHHNKEYLLNSLPTIETSILAFHGITPLARVSSYLLSPSFWCVVVDVLDISTSPCLGGSCRQPSANTPISEKDLLGNALEIMVLSGSWGRVFPLALTDTSLKCQHSAICIHGSVMFQDFLQHA